MKHYSISANGYATVKLLLSSPLVIWSCACVIIISAYWPSLAGPLVFDDQLNIIENPAVAIHDLSYASLKRAALSNESGLLKRILPALSFGINHYLAGGFANTYVFKLTNLAVHIVNSALAFWLCYLLWPRCRSLIFSNSNGISRPSENTTLLPAAFVALVWALHPIQSSAVVYVVQRMTSMSATFVLLGLAIFLVGRERFDEQRSYALTLMSAGIIGGTALGLLCKENAALLGLYAGVIEFTLFSRETLTQRQKRRLLFFYGLLVIAPFSLGAFYMFVYPGGILEGYAGRPFSLGERLLTQARVLWFYLYLLAVPDIVSMGLFHDDIPISTGWLSPWTTLPSVIAWILVALLGLLLRRRSQVVAFAILWYLAGHSMESTFIPLEMVFEHRNYLPSLGPILALCVMVHSGGVWIEKHRAEMQRAAKLVPWIIPGLSVAILVNLYWLSLSQAEYWYSEDGFIASQALNHPDSASCQYLYGEVLYKKQRNPMAAYPYYYRAAQLKPNEAGFLISLHMVTPIGATAGLQKWQYPKLLDPQYIEGLLHNGPVSAWGMRALDVAGRCVLSKFPSCREHIDDARSWLQAFAANPLTGEEMQRHFLTARFNIEMTYGRFGDALQTAQQGKIRDSGYLGYELMYADALAASKRFAEALQALAAVRQKWEGNPGALPAIDKLRSAVMKAQTSAASS